MLGCGKISSFSKLATRIATGQIDHAIVLRGGAANQAVPRDCLEKACRRGDVGWGSIWLEHQTRNLLMGSWRGWHFHFSSLDFLNMATHPEKTGLSGYVILQVSQIPTDLGLSWCQIECCIAWTWIEKYAEWSWIWGTRTGIWTLLKTQIWYLKDPTWELALDLAFEHHWRNSYFNMDLIRRSCPRTCLWTGPGTSLKKPLTILCCSFSMRLIALIVCCL